MKAGIFFPDSATNHATIWGISAILSLTLYLILYNRMHTLSWAAPAAVLLSAAMLMPHLTAAQAADSLQRRPTTAAEKPSSTGTLVRVGTGFTRGLSSGYWGLSVPVVLGVEHHLTPAFSLYANGFAGFYVGKQQRYFNNTRESIIGDYGFDLGVKYYYNQEKRRRQGRATGPFAGNYLSLQSSSVFTANSFRTPYNYSTLTVQWGMQRRLGKYGWFEAYVGAGLGREPSYTYYDDAAGPRRRTPHLGIATEVGIQRRRGKVVR